MNNYGNRGVGVSVMAVVSRRRSKLWHKIVAVGHECKIRYRSRKAALVEAVEEAVDRSVRAI